MWCVAVRGWLGWPARLMRLIPVGGGWGGEHAVGGWRKAQQQGPHTFPHPTSCSSPALATSPTCAPHTPYSLPSSAAISASTCTRALGALRSSRAEQRKGAHPHLPPPNRPWPPPVSTSPMRSAPSSPPPPRHGAHTSPPSLRTRAPMRAPQRCAPPRLPRPSTRRRPWGRRRQLSRCVRVCVRGLGAEGVRRLRGLESRQQGSQQ